MSAHRLNVDVDEKRIDAIFREVDQCQLPGAAVGIAIRGRPVYRKGFGLASMELPVVLSPTIRMRIGSTTKHFTALAYLLLCEDGKAGIDDPIGRHLPDLHPIALKVTARQLMMHLGGLRDAYAICWDFSGMGNTASSAELLSLYRSMDDVNAAPGTAWIYSNGGYLLLSAAIERIAGQTLERVMRERIFEPIGMHDTRLRRRDSDFVPNSATLHNRNAEGHFDRAYLGTALDGAGGMVSTIDDMLRWMAHWDAPHVGSAATWAEMRTPRRLANQHSSGYGLGLFVDHYRGVETLWHAGGVIGGNSQMLKVPSAGLDVVILVNRQDLSSMSLAHQVVDACLPGLDPIGTPFNGPFVTGVFRSRTTGRVLRLFNKNDKQLVCDSLIERSFERCDNDGILWDVQAWGDPREGVSMIGDPVHPRAIRYHDFGNVDELLRVPAAHDAGAARIVGSYRSHSTDIRASISQTEAGPRLTMDGKWGSVVYPLECIASGVWVAKPGLLSFDEEGAGFRYFNYSTRGLHFRRCN